MEVSVIKNKVEYKVTIDDEDLQLFNTYKWSILEHKSKNKKYLVRHYYLYNNKKRTCKIIYFHREIMGVTNKDVPIDHINGNGLDNRKLNLRECTVLQNNQNTRKYRNNSSGYKGVSWKKQYNKWVARIDVNKKRIELGYFDNVIDAYQAYCKASDLYHKEFSNKG